MIMAQVASLAALRAAKIADVHEGGEVFSRIAPFCLCPSKIDLAWSWPASDTHLLLAVMPVIGAIIGAVAVIWLGRRLHRDFEKTMRPLDRHRSPPGGGGEGRRRQAIGSK